MNNAEFYSKFRVLDDKGRVLLKVRGNQVLVARYDSLSTKTKESIAEIYVELTGEKVSKIMDFLDFKNDDIEFCS